MSRNSHNPTINETMKLLHLSGGRNSHGQTWDDIFTDYDPEKSKRDDSPVLFAVPESSLHLPRLRQRRK